MERAYWRKRSSSRASVRPGSAWHAWKAKRPQRRKADWDTRRAILRALIKHVEVGKEAIRVVYKVNPDPFDQDPERGRSQDCWRGGHAALRHPETMNTG